ncbi:MAG: UDP-N-acetylglucosamine 2-epimerase, partial [Calditrichaeota bacterium]|nr:UDP-N-acetylglucosamine 2-epimerase [Calditrichota bacterium]
SFEIPKDKKIVTVTLHRREGLNSLEKTLSGIRLAAQSREDAYFICPIHPNPVVQSAFNKCFGDIKNVKLVQALDYASFIKLLLKTDLVLTDSGGVQEEASLLGKRTLVARSKTERDNGIKDGLVTIVGVHPENIYSCISQNLDSEFSINISNKPIIRSTEIITDVIERAML